MQWDNLVLGDTGAMAKKKAKKKKDDTLFYLWYEESGEWVHNDGRVCCSEPEGIRGLEKAIAVAKKFLEESFVDSGGGGESREILFFTRHSTLGGYAEEKLVVEFYDPDKPKKT